MTDDGSGTIVAGKVAVEIVPKATGFAEKLRAQVEPGSARVGDDIGARIASAIAKQVSSSIRQGLAAAGRDASAEAKAAGAAIGESIAKPIAEKTRKGIGDGLDAGGRGAGTKGSKVGEEYGGNFAQTLKRRLEVAFKSLPDAKITADSTDADLKIAAIRAEMEALSKQRIGVDLDEGLAFAQIERLRGELDRLGADSASISVKADTAFASAQLDKITVEADRVAALSPSIKVDADTGGAEAKLAAVGAESEGSAGGVNALTFAIVALGPAAIPAAAAAVGAIAAIGTAAAGAAAGVGVGILAFSGISDAVKALGAAHADTAKNAAQLASRQTQIAGATDQVRSAEASLANTRASNADAAIRASQQVATARQGVTDAVRGENQAEVSLASAHDQERRSQLALTQAHEDARRALEDLATQVEDGALAQRQAALDATQAQNALNLALTNPRGTQQQREQAQLAYDQAVQRIKDLKIQQDRAVADKAKADKAGIAGSQQVVAAQQQVVQATNGVAQAQNGVVTAHERVAKAQQAVADALRSQVAQQRQAAFSIAQAQQGVISAQRSLGAATVAAGVQGSGSMDALRKAMAALSPEGQKFAAFLYGLKPQLAELKASAAGGLLPGVEAGIKTLLPVMPLVNQFVGSLARTMGTLFAEGTRALTAPFWRQFFTYLANTAGPSITTIVHVVENLGAGFAGLLQAFAPVATQVSSGLLHMSESFANFGVTASRNRQFQQFLAYVMQVGPQVMATIGDIAGAAIHLAVALAPIGGVVLGGLRLLSQIISGIPTPVLTALAAAIIIVVGAMQLWSLRTTALKVALVGYTIAQRLAAAATEAYSAAVTTAGPATARFGSTVGALAGAGAGAKAGLSGIMGMLGGPWGVALIGATVLVGLFIAKQQEVKQRTEQLTQALGGLSDAYRQFQAGQPDSLKALVAQNAGLQDLIINSAKYGIAVGDIAKATDGNAQSGEKLRAAYDAQIDSLTKLLALNDAKDVVGTGGDERKRIEALIEKRREERDAIGATIDAKTKAKEATDLLTGAEQNSAAVTKLTTPAQQALANALKVLADNTSTAADKANALKTAEDALTGGAKSQIDAQDAYAKAVLASSAAVKDHGHSLARNTEAGQANRDALKNLITSSVDLYNADIAAGVPADEATRRHLARVAALDKEWGRTKDTHAAVKSLTDAYGKVPTAVITDVQIRHAKDIQAQLDSLLVKQFAAQQGITPQQAFQQLTHNQSANALEHLFRAQGGPITGPGSKTSDSVRVMASAGEYMQQASAVDYYGVGFMDAINHRRIPKEALGYAGGGLIVPFVVDVGKTKIPQPSGGGPANLGASSTPAINAILAVARTFNPQAQVSSGYRPGDPGYHGQGLAADLIGGGVAGMLKIAQGFYAISNRLLEEIYSNGSGYYVKNGRRVGGSFYASELAGHHNHVHIAARADALSFDDGGYLPPGLSSVYNGLGRPEPLGNLDKIAAGSSGSGGRDNRPNITVHAAPHWEPAQILTVWRNQEALMAPGFG